MGTGHSGNYKKVIPAGWVPSAQERTLPLFGVRWDKVGTALSLLGPISSQPTKAQVQTGKSIFQLQMKDLE